VFLFTQEVTFLGLIVTTQSVKVDKSKIEVIQSWPTSSSIQEGRSFHALASFYRQFIRDFSTITTPMTKVLNGTSFKWTPKAQQTFEEIRKKLTQVSVVAL